MDQRLAGPGQSGDQGFSGAAVVAVGRGDDRIGVVSVLCERV
jgi:hypothetical protein